MNLVRKILLKLKIEIQFLLEQKWGIRRPADPFTIPKFILKKYLPVNPIIIDCGAHVGADSIELARIFPQSVVHSFEPVPAIHASLLKNTRRYKNIYCYELGLSDKTGVALMNVSSGASDASSSLLAPTGHLQDHPDVFFSKRIEIQTFTLDDWAALNGYSEIDFLWLDMQGMEFSALSASKKILQTVKAIHCEVSLRESYQNSQVYSQFRQWLESNNFGVVLEAVPQGSDMGNVLFVRATEK